MANFGEVLADFKRMSMGEPENIVPIIDNAELANGLIAWKSVPITYKNTDEDCTAKDEVSQWNWLWSGVSFDMTTFSTVAGVRQQDAGSLFLRLKGLRLIYPDGTISALAKQYLQAQIMAKLSKFSKPAKAPPKSSQKPTSAESPKQES